MGSSQYPLVAPPQGGNAALPGPGQPQPMQPGEFIAGATPNQVSFGFDTIDPPSALYVQRDDVIRVEAQTNRAAGDTINFMLRFLRVPERMGGQPSDGGVGRTPGAYVPGGIVDIVTHDIVIPAGNQFLVTDQVFLAEGYLLSITARSQSVQRRGITFARAHLTRFPNGIFQHSQLLFADYVTLFSFAGWPGGRYLSSLEGPGLITSMQVANPGAGAQWTFTAGVVQRFRPVSFTAQLVTSAVAGSRIVKATIDDGANIVSSGVANQTIPASTTALVTGTTSITSAGAGIADVLCGLPGNCFLNGGWRLRSVVTNMDVGDAWTNIWLNMEQWVDNA